LVLTGRIKFPDDDDTYSSEMQAKPLSHTSPYLEIRKKRTKEEKNKKRERKGVEYDKVRTLIMSSVKAMQRL
jgi:hypothetical protein